MMTMVDVKQDSLRIMADRSFSGRCHISPKIEAMTDNMNRTRAESQQRQSLVFRATCLAALKA